MSFTTAKKIAKDIKSLKIQGASKVRKAVVEGIEVTVTESDAKSADALRKEIKQAAKILLVRPTEPETRTAVRIILKAAAKDSDVKQLKQNVLKEIADYEKNKTKAMQKIAENSLKLFKNKKVVFTHCHSHTVEEIIKLAWKKNKVERVIATETRPRFQGRITATNLSKIGIPVTHIVDSAAASFISEADIFLSGADAVIANGDVVNKIGTSLIAEFAKKKQVPYYACTSSHAFDSATYFGKEEVIEQRDVNEIWEQKLRNVTIKNPAFDVTEAGNVRGIITEKGIFTPKKFTSYMVKHLKLKGNKKEFVSLERLLK